MPESVSPESEAPVSTGAEQGAEVPSLPTSVTRLQPLNQRFVTPRSRAARGSDHKSVEADAELSNTGAERDPRLLERLKLDRLNTTRSKASAASTKRELGDRSGGAANNTDDLIAKIRSSFTSHADSTSKRPSMPNSVGYIEKSTDSVQTPDTSFANLQSKATGNEISPDSLRSQSSMPPTAAQTRFGNRELSPIRPHEPVDRDHGSNLIAKTALSPNLDGPTDSQRASSLVPTAPRSEFVPSKFADHVTTSEDSSVAQAGYRSIRPLPSLPISTSNRFPTTEGHPGDSEKRLFDGEAGSRLESARKSAAPYRLGDYLKRLSDQ